MRISVLFALVAGLLFFGIWMSIVGNPHVVETAIGLLIAAALGFWVYRKTKSKTEG